MKKLLVIITLASTLFIAVRASTPGVYITVNGTGEKIALKPGKYKNLSRCSNPHWRPEPERNYLISANKGVEMDGDWEKIEFEFIPESDGSIQLQLAGKLFTAAGENKPAELWTAYDSFEISGAVLVNPDFEQANSKGAPVGWDISKGAILVRQSDEAHSGKNFLAVTATAPAWQFIKVKKGEKVSVKFYAKPLERRP